MTHGIQMTSQGFVQGSTDPIEMGGTKYSDVPTTKYTDADFVAKGAEQSQSIGSLLNQFGFSPELVLFIANKRMNDIDGQVRASMAELDETASESEAVGEKIAALREVQEHLAAAKKEGVYVDPVAHDKVHNFIDTGTEKVGAREFLEARGVVLEKDVKTSMGPHGRRSVQSETVDAAIKKLEEKQQEINTGNELRMVKLQSLMQQRTQILTLATNLLQKLDEGTQSIVRNLA